MVVMIMMVVVKMTMMVMMMITVFCMKVCPYGHMGPGLLLMGPDPLSSPG